MPEPLYDLCGKRVWVAGHRGMVGSALVRRLHTLDCEILTVDRANLDLTRQEDVERWLQQEKPHAIFLAAAKVGGIVANDMAPAQFLYDNLAMSANIIHTAVAPVNTTSPARPPRSSMRRSPSPTRACSPKRRSPRPSIAWGSRSTAPCET
jgi:NAD(P)-dependent dehydrogenase (short-subunit alcohol dehydrogenase family)